MEMKRYIIGLVCENISKPLIADYYNGMFAAFADFIENISVVILFIVVYIISLFVLVLLMM